MAINLVFSWDHAGRQLGLFLMEKAQEWGYEAHSFGAPSFESVDYPDFVFETVTKVLDGNDTLGVLICGSGIGMSIAANRYKGIRAALCHSDYEARVAREHNNANILCLGERVLGTGQAASILNTFLQTHFAGGRHEIRINKMDNKFY